MALSMEVAGLTYFLVATCLFIVISNVTANFDPYMKITIDRQKPVFTSERLSQFDGSDENKPLFMAVKGVVFDVSSGKSFYGKGAPYNALIGKDATQGVARMSLEPQHLNSDITSLTEAELKGLDDIFKGTYMAKYPVVGYMDYLIKMHEEPVVNDEL